MTEAKRAGLEAPITQGIGLSIMETCRLCGQWKPQDLPCKCQKPPAPAAPIIVPKVEQKESKEQKETKEQKEEFVEIDDPKKVARIQAELTPPVWKEFLESKEGKGDARASSTSDTQRVKLARDIQAWSDSHFTPKTDLTEEDDMKHFEQVLLSSQPYTYCCPHCHTRNTADHDRWSKRKCAGCDKILRNPRHACVGECNCYST